MESLEAPGQWWLPERPDIKVAGTLAVAENGSAELRLIGSLRSFMEAGESVAENGLITTVFSERSMQAAGLYPRILGLADGRAFTLDDCIQTRRTENLFGGGLAYESIRVRQVLRGAHFDSGEDLEFVSAVVYLDWLAYWVVASGISESMEMKEVEGAVLEPIEHRLTMKRIDSQEFLGLEGAEIRLEQAYGLNGDYVTERRLWQDFYFVVEVPRAVALSDLLYHVGALQNLLSIGTGRTGALKSITLRRPGVSPGADSAKYDMPIDLFAQWPISNPEAPRRLHSHELPFTLAQLGGVAGISQWLNAVEPHMAAVARILTTRYGPSPYASDSFMNCAAALEGYDKKKFGDGIIYVNRLKRCIQNAGVEFAGLVGQTDAWAAAVKKMRNDVAHHNAGMMSASTEQLLLGKSAYWLLILCLLRDAGVPNDVFANIAEHDAFGRLRAQLANLY
jgi:hypothetical protein